MFLSVGQHPNLVSSEIVNSFLLSAQVETCAEKCEECSLDIFLMNGYQITVTALSTERSHQILEVGSFHIIHRAALDEVLSSLSENYISPCKTVICL